MPEPYEERAPWNVEPVAVLPWGRSAAGGLPRSGACYDRRVVDTSFSAGRVRRVPDRNALSAAPRLDSGASAGTGPGRRPLPRSSPGEASWQREERAWKWRTHSIPVGSRAVTGPSAR